MSDNAFIERQRVIRSELLAALYVLRTQGNDAFVRNLTHTLGFAPDECRFALGYLVEKQLVERTGIYCRITAKGIADFEQETP